MLKTAICGWSVRGDYHHITKTLLVMKLTVFLLTAAFLNVSAKGVSQNINFSGDNVSLQSVLKEVKKQTGFLFMYAKPVLRASKPVSISAENVPLEQFLAEVFKSQPLEYNISGKTIFVTEKGPGSSKPDLNSSGTGELAFSPIRGKVMDDNGQPLVGASITIKNTKTSKLTDSEGLFFLNVNEGDIIVITYVEHQSKEIKISSAMISSGTISTITLSKSSTMLDETIVIAYGQVEKKFSTSNITTVKAKDIEKQPVTNPLLALEGMVPGLVVTQSTGFANSGVTVRIQGQNSIQYGNDPLYVVDGVPYFSQNVPSMLGDGPVGNSGIDFSNNTNGFGAGGNPLSFINPASIESIEVLKDADATAIYGSRAANGAILITTKKGKAGETRVNINLQSGQGKMTRREDMLNTEQYLAMRKEAYKNDGLAFPPTVPTAFNYDLTVWDQNRYTDWQEVLLGGTAKYNDAQLSVSGGSVNTQFLVGGGFHQETTVFPGKFSDRKGSLNFSVNNISPNQKFRIQLTGSYMLDDNKLPGLDLTRAALTLAPNSPAIYNADGTLNWEPLPNGTTTFKNPLAFFKNTYRNQTNNLVFNTLLSYELLPGLFAKTSLSYTNNHSYKFSTGPLSAMAPEAAAISQNSSSFSNSTMNSYSIEPQFTYTKAIAKGTIDALIGGTLQQSKTNEVELTGVGYSSELLLEDLQSATSIPNNQRYSPSSVYKYDAIFGRLNYNLADKYILNITGRRDGSSRFGKSDGFHTFGSIAGAWLFFNENMVKDNLPFLSFGKIRLSYGSTGSDQIGNYQFLSQYQAVDNYGGVAYQGINGLQPNGLSNPHLAWELTRKLQGGIDLGFFKDRILLNVTYYRNRTSNELLPYKLPYLTGSDNVVVNFPATVQNKGWEISLNTVNTRSAAFSWSSAINVTIARNKLLAFPNLANSTYSTILVVGQPITVVPSFHYLGVDPATGLPQIADKDGKPTASPNPLTDRTTYIDQTPKFYGGFQNNFSYKGFQLSVFFQFAKQMGFGDRGFKPGSAIFAQSLNILVADQVNQPVTVLKRWQNPGDVTDVLKFSTYNFPASATGRKMRTAYSSFLTSDAPYEDASYIRLKNVSLSWALPRTWINKAGMKAVRLFVQGQNLLTITNYNGLDPETRSSATLPPLRVITFGVQAGL